MANMIVMFEVSATNVGSVMQALAPRMADLIDFRMESKADTTIKVKRQCAPRGSRVEDIIIERLTNAAESRLPIGDLGNALAEAGLKASSASPGVTSLERAGKVRRLPGKEVELV